MALQKQTVSLNLANGIDQKEGDFTGSPNGFADLQNCVFNKDKEMSKRRGTQALPTTVSTDFPAPLTIGASDIPSSVMNYKNQLLLQNKGALYSYDEGDTRWAFKGHYYPIKARTETLNVNQTQVAQETIIRDGRRIVTTTGPQGLTVDFEDATTGNKIKSVNISAAGFWATLLPFNNALYVVYQDVNTIFIRPITPATETVGSATSLKANGDTNCRFDWTYSLQGGVERFFCSYQRTTLFIDTFAVTAAGILDATLGTNSFAVTSFANSGQLALYYSPTNQRLYLGFKDTSGASALLRVRILTFTASAYTVVAAAITIETGVAAYTGVGKFNKGFFVDDPTTAAQVAFVYEQSELPFAYLTDQALNVKIQYLNATTTVSAPFFFAKCFGIQSKGWIDTDRNTVYFMSGYSSPNRSNSALFMLDIFRGHLDSGLPISHVVGKFYEGSYGDAPLVLPYISDKKVYFTASKKTEIVAYDISSLPLFEYVSSLLVVDLAPDTTGANVFLAETLNMTGGFLSQYDGNSFFENNFFIGPDAFEARTPAGTALVELTKITEGSGADAEVWDVNFPSAVLLVGYSAPTFRFDIYYNATQFVRVGYRINGAGSNVTGGTVNVTVPLDGNESAYQVAAKTVEYLGSANFNLTFRGGAVVRFQNYTLVSVPDATQNFNTSIGQSTAGSHSYCMIAAWPDANGQFHKSAPSPIATVTSAGYQVGLTGRMPNISLRPLSQIQPQFFGTAANGTTLYRQVGSGGEVFSRISAQANYPAGELDASFTKNEIIYTNGGVLPNAPTIGSCDFVSDFKDRLMVSGMDNQTLMYSKTSVTGEPVSLASELFITMNHDQQKIVGHAQLDDKLIVGRDESLVAFAGDGANDLGTGLSFSQPQDVATDVGVQNGNSMCITPAGLYFQSKMGIQLLDRGLNVTYPGVQVKDFNDSVIQKAIVLTRDKVVREIRFVLADVPKTLVYNYLTGLWSSFTNYAGQDATLWRGVFARVNSSGVVFVEQTSTFTDVGSSGTYNQFFRTEWLKLKNMQDYQRIYRMMLLGDLKTPHTLEVKAYYDYDPNNFDTYTFSSSNITGTGWDDIVYEPEFHLKTQKCVAVQFEVTVVPTGTNTEECLTLTDLSFEIGVKQGLQKTKKAKKL